MKWNDKIALDWVIFVYETVMMQQKYFSRWNASKQNVVYDSKGRKLCQIDTANL